MRSANRGPAGERVSAHEPPKLLTRVRHAIRVRHMSPKTEKAYVYWIREFILFHGKRHPEEMAEAEVTAFLTHLATARRVSASTQNQALSALLFLYSTFSTAIWAASTPFGRAAPAGFPWFSRETRCGRCSSVCEEPPISWSCSSTARGCASTSAWS